MEGLEEVWKALRYGAWNILTPIHCMRSGLQLIPVGITFSTELNPKRVNIHRNIFVQRRNKSQSSSPDTCPDGLLVTVPWKDLHSQADTGRHYHCTESWPSLISFFTKMTQQKYQQALKLLNQAATSCQLSTVPVPAEKEQGHSTTPRATCFSRH